MAYLIDTHAHIDMAEDIDAVIKNAHDSNVKKIMQHSGSAILSFLVKNGGKSFYLIAYADI